MRLCPVPECGDPVGLDGLCVACYHRRRRNPETFDVTQPRKRKGGPVEPNTLAADYARLWTVAQMLWDRLSLSNGWLACGGVQREDTIPANIAALEAGRELGLGEE